MATILTFREQTLSLDEEYAILETCRDWSPIEAKARRREMGDFIQEWVRQFEQLDLIFGPSGEEWPFADKSPYQLLNVVRLLRAHGTTLSKEQARSLVKMQVPLLKISDSTLDALVETAVRSWTLVNVRNPDDMSVGGGRPCVWWEDGSELKHAIRNPFPQSTTELTLGQRRLSPLFTAANMSNVKKLRIEWATTIDDHLSLDRHKRVLRVFPLRNWLHAEAEAATNATDALLPKELYLETSRTLDLLFPSWDKKTQKFLARYGKDFHRTNTGPRMLDLKHYSYWRDHLLELNEDIFLAPPEDWFELWHDRRDPQKFWTFWIALCVLWLTVCGTVATVVQTWATLKKPG